MYRWGPVDVAEPSERWATRVERSSQRTDIELEDRVALRRGEETVAVAEPGEALRVTRDSITVVGVERSLELGRDLHLEVSYVDPGWTAVNATLWSLAGTATALSAAFIAVMMSIFLGGEDASP